MSEHDTYTGEVAVGGDPAVRQAGCLRITKLAVDEQMANNAYLLRCDQTGEQVLVDAADDAPRLLAAIGDDGLSAVVTTHQHWDHHRALADVVAATGAAVVAGAPDADAITEQTGVPVTRRVEHGDTVTVGACTVEVVRLTGHTPGSIALLFDEDGSVSGRPHLWTGDSLFPGGVGRTTSPEDFGQLLDDVELSVFDRLPDQTWFYPGHGNDSTIGAERPSLGEWRERGW